MKKFNLKKLFIYINVALILSITLSFIYIFFPKLPDSLDNRLRDYFFTIRGEIPTSNNVVIVDIDEHSLQELGQWPWPRNKISKILKNLTDAGVTIIGFDVVFAEEDNSSPHKVLKQLNIKKDNIPNYDLDFAQTIASTPTILGYLFELKKREFLNNAAPKIPAIYIEKNKQLGKESLIKGVGTVLNIPLLQDNSYSSGFFNNIPDESGIIRSVPLVISYDDIIYPSLGLELLRILLDTDKVYINYDEEGVSTISLANIEIPTDRYGRVLVNFRGKEKTFNYISANDIYNNSFKKEEVAEKIVLIGTSAAGLLDLRATPFESVFPGVEVHANVIDNIIQGDFIYKASWVDGANIFIIFFLSILIVLLIKYTPFWMNPVISISFLVLSLYALYKILFTYGIVLNIFFPIATIILGTILATLFDYFYEIKQEEAIKKKFASKVSQEVMNSLLKDVHSNEFQAMEKEVTVFFSDIRNFTKISEKMKDANKLISYLNEYMDPMSNIIIKYQGTIDKYIGDAIMAYWNAPADVDNHADKAVLASIEQIESLKALNKKLQNDNKPLVDIGIGLNSGTAVVGEMGSIGRSDYTVIGDAINLGARLESLCKYYGSKINISNHTKEKLKGQYILRFLDLVKVKGKEKPAEIWQVQGKGEASKELKEELELHHKAIKLYQNSKFKEALEIFIKLENNPEKSNKKIYQIYIQRCEDFIQNPPSNFIGIYEHSTKG
ncbi:CHASE2 domain-containing protein [Arcobacter sp. YIC-310]|uniref:CHASE2 domain-containing protein n=1 Tax=Arcobacter sp. YIC-310 TaxID=3376632 RepID=UPI003C17EEE2